MQETTIELHFRTNDFREIYYANGQSNVFNGSTRKF